MIRLLASLCCLQGPGDYGIIVSFPFVLLLFLHWRCMGKGYVPYLEKGLKFLCDKLVITNPCKTASFLFFSTMLLLFYVVGENTSTNKGLKDDILCKSRLVRRAC